MKSKRAERPIADLETHLGYWLRLVSNRVSHAFQARIEARGVTVAEWVVMRALFDSQETHPSDLAAAIGLSRGAVSKLVDRLVIKQLVACAQDEADRRFQTVRLTREGRSLVPKLAALADENDKEFFGDMDRASREALMSALMELANRHGIKSAPLE